MVAMQIRKTETGNLELERKEIAITQNANDARSSAKRFDKSCVIDLREGASSTSEIVSNAYKLHTVEGKNPSANAAPKRRTASTRIIHFEACFIPKTSKCSSLLAACFKLMQLLRMFTNGHTIVRIPHPVRSAKSSTFWLG